MILRCTFEELTALTSGAKSALAAASSHDSSVAAPPRAVADIEALLPRLDGDVAIETLAEQESVERAVHFVLAHLKDEMDGRVLDEYVGAEDATNAYFDYAHVLTIHDRVQRIGREMSALIELMTGRPPTEEAARRITFPDPE